MNIQNPTYQEVLTQMCTAYAEHAGTAPEMTSAQGVRMQVLAGEVYALYRALYTLGLQSFPQTAMGEALDRHAQQRGLARMAAVQATGELTFWRLQPLGYDVRVPAGTVCATAGTQPQSFVTTEEVTLAAGDLEVTTPAHAVIGGENGNVEAEEIRVLVSCPVGIDGVENAAAFAGGREAESDEMLRSRLIQSYAVLSNGMNAEFYRRSALACPGVSSVYVVPQEDGEAGEVSVYLWGDGAPATDETVAAVLQKLEQEREIGVTVQVKKAQAQTVPVSVYITPNDNTTFAAAKPVVEQALRQYIASMQVGEPVYLAQLGRVILETGFVRNYQFPLAMSDVTVLAGYVAQCGTVTVAEL